MIRDKTVVVNPSCKLRVTTRLRSDIDGCDLRVDKRVISPKKERKIPRGNELELLGGH